VDAPKQSVAGLFGRAAAAYDRVGFFHQGARRLLVVAGVGHGMRVLDVACGAGAVLAPAARLVGPAGLAVGIDLAEPMAAVAASKLQRLDQGHGAVVVMDAARLGLRAGWFDVVCCASAIYLLDDQAAAVRGWLEVLRPGGVLAVSEFGDLDARWAWKDQLLRRFGPPLAPLGGGHLGPPELERLLGSAGANRVRVQVERLDVVYADAAAWWAQQWALASGERWSGWTRRRWLPTGRRRPRDPGLPGSRRRVALAARGHLRRRLAVTRRLLWPSSRVGCVGVEPGVVPDQRQPDEARLLVDPTRSSMPRITAGADDHQPHTGIAELLHRKPRQRRADPVALHQRVDRQHVDLPRLALGVDVHGDVADRPPVLLSDPDRGGVVLADGLHGARLAGCPVRIQRLVDPFAQDRAERREHRRPGAKRELHDGRDVGSPQRTDGRTHDHDSGEASLTRTPNTRARPHRQPPRGPAARSICP
jgi:SAM-dependent methyltransferase